MAERVLKTYRCDKALVSAVSAQARARGETVTDVIERAFRAYIQGDSPAQPVYTPSVPPLRPAPRPVYECEDIPSPPCAHPVESVQDGYCHECKSDVW